MCSGMGMLAHMAIVIRLCTSFNINGLKKLLIVWCFIIYICNQPISAGHNDSKTKNIEKYFSGDMLMLIQICFSII